MTIILILLLLSCERLFKYNDKWHLDRWFKWIFNRLCNVSIIKNLILLFFGIILLSGFFVKLISNWLYNIPLMLLWIIISSLCIGAGSIRRQYRRYLLFASNKDINKCIEISSQLALSCGLSKKNIVDWLYELQNTLLWINFRFYLAPLFWLLIGRSYGLIFLISYVFLRSCQIWLLCHSVSFKQQAQFGVNLLLHWLDWVPVRLISISYILFGDSEKTLRAWFSSLTDIHSSQYHILINIAQFSLTSKTASLDIIRTPVATVSLAKKITLAFIMITVFLTIYGVIS